MYSIKKSKIFLLLGFLLSSMINSCDETESVNNDKDTEIISVKAPDFNADTAYYYIQKQLSFGNRVPGTPTHAKTAQWITQELKKNVDTVYVQKSSVVQIGSNKSYPITNIIASVNPSNTNRILLLAHWDSRPWADQDTLNKDKPIMAADDGASGVAVLMEIARVLKSQKINLGVDILLVDAEDLGKTEWGEDSYCLGTQYWAKNPHIPAYKAKYGICLDMVGSKGAQFPLEQYSQTYAPDVQRKIWDIANRIGYADYFRYVQSAPITDDHVYINESAKIPCVDIINLKPNGNFGNHWHTHNDNIEIIDKSTLKAVGQTVLQAIYDSE